MTAITRYIFVDESGDITLTEYNAKIPSVYVITAIMIEPDDLEICQKKAIEIVRKHAGEGELKSSSIGSNVERRTSILRDIAQSGLQYYCFVVDKAKIWQHSGLRFRPVFYKFVHRMFYLRIHQSYIGLNVIADLHGGSSFMQSFEKYILSFSNLFNKFQFLPSHDVPLLQIADVIAGSVRRVYHKDDSDELLKILHYPAFPLDEWPPNLGQDFELIANSSSDDSDSLVRHVAINAAIRFVEENITDHDETEQLRAWAVEYLMQKYKEEPNEYIYRGEIVEYLNSISRVNIDEHFLTTEIFAPARDAGVIIASTDKGVKIPFDARDCMEWIHRISNQVVPYLRRLEKARNAIMIASNNKFDILNPDLFPDLFKYIKRSV